jgi:hypothetical protein
MTRRGGALLDLFSFLDSKLPSWLKNDSGEAVNAIWSSLDFFFAESTNGQKPVFQDEIVAQGVTYDCKASQSDCWNALKTVMKVNKY